MWDTSQKSAKTLRSKLKGQYIVGDICTVIGGLGVGGNTCKGRERYEREARQEPQVWSLEQRPPKSSRGERGSITLTEEDAQRVHIRHNDPLFIVIQIAYTRVHQTLVDNGSSLDILYFATFKKMCLGLKDLKPCATPIYGFTGDSVRPLRMIELAFTVGESPKHATMMATFFLVDFLAAFNFPTLKGVATLKGEQKEGRECYNISLRLATETKNPTIKAVPDDSIGGRDAKAAGK
uniref:Uncharacterized protein n=1 Tax=Cannabis sativa TaxID=3483 RepID=A0A803QCA6_CANSA